MDRAEHANAAHDLPAPMTYADSGYAAEVPADLSFFGDAAAVEIAADGRIFVFNRGARPMVILDQSGRYVRGWGDPERYPRPHGMSWSADGSLLLVDSGAHIVDRVTTDGHLLMRIGAHGQPSEPYSGEPFNQPTDVVEHPTSRELFVSDGYGNSRIHRFDASGDHILSWGSPGTGPLDLSNPHGLCFVEDDVLAVCDRENYRIQFYDLEGALLDSWHWHHPSSIRRGPDGLLFIAELGPPGYMHGSIPNMGCCVTVVTKDGTIVDRLGDRMPGTGIGRLLAPHGLGISHDGDVYVAEVNTVYLEAIGVPSDDPDPTCVRRWIRS